LISRVESGDLVGRDQSLRLYRNVLLEARSNDFRLDPSETSILGVLRRELRIRPVEHFLIEHHPTFRDFWGKEHAFLDSITTLRGSGILFVHEGRVLLAEEVVPVIRQALGLEMSSAKRRRLFERLSGGELNDVLAGCDLKTSGTRDAKVDRLLENYVQPSEALALVSLQTLRNVCREVNATLQGAKEELVERLVHHFLHDLDLREHPQEVGVQQVTAEPEPRILPPTRFRAMFSSFKGDELGDILVSIDSHRVTGAKDLKVDLLEASRFGEGTLLGHLTNRALEDVLQRQRLRSSGSKQERIERLVQHFASLPESALSGGPAPSVLEVANGLPAEGESREPGAATHLRGQ
jgi:hypothetical protein